MIGKLGCQTWYLEGKKNGPRPSILLSFPTLSESSSGEGRSSSGITFGHRQSNGAGMTQDRLPALLGTLHFLEKPTHRVLHPS